MFLGPLYDTLDPKSCRFDPKSEKLKISLIFSDSNNFNHPNVRERESDDLFAALLMDETGELYM